MVFKQRNLFEALFSIYSNVDKRMLQMLYGFICSEMRFAIVVFRIICTPLWKGKRISMKNCFRFPFPTIASLVVTTIYSHFIIAINKFLIKKNIIALFLLNRTTLLTIWVCIVENPLPLLTLHFIHKHCYVFTSTFITYNCIKASEKRIENPSNRMKAIN